MASFPIGSNPTIRICCVLASFMASLGCEPARSLTVTPRAIIEPGALVVIGGRLEPDNHALFEAMLDLRVDEAPVCVIPTASAEPQASMNAYLDDFRRHGGASAAVGVELEAGAVEAAHDPALAQRLRGCGGFFFTGGDQSRIVDTFKPDGRPSPAYLALIERHRAGAFIAGTSAGAAMMSDPMIGGGDSDGALRHGICGYDGCEGVWVRDGMGLWPGWITDQHFLVRGRAGRLLAVLVADPDGPRLGLGVDEDTGVLVRGGEAEVVGRSGALVIDATAARREGDTWTGVAMHLYGPGDRFDTRDGRLVASGRATEPVGDAISPPADEQPFEGFGFTALLLALAESESDSGAVEGATVAGDGWSVHVARGPGFEAGPPRGPFGIRSAGPFVVELTRSGGAADP